MLDNQILCTICQGITLNALTSSTGYLHHASYQALESCAQQCPVCNIFVSALKECEDLDGYLQQQDSGKQIHIGACDGSYVGLEINTNLTHLDLLVERQRLTRLQLYAAADDAAALSGIVAGRQISSHSNSDANFQLIRQWLRECLTRHRFCSMNSHSEASNPRLPTRVIDVTYSDPRVVETQGESGLYIALSHCWGKLKTLVTNISTLPERRKGIEFQSLPKTFRDAIVVTRALGYQYLWIDSLCIIQDSDSDWQREASLMGAYYGRAHLTISATSADGDHTGFLNARTPRASAPVELALALPNGDIGRICIALEPSNAAAGAFYDNVERSPVSKRAWILQERVLSPRILHFGQAQILWECRSYKLSEDGSSLRQSLSGLQRTFGPNMWIMDTRYGSPPGDVEHIGNMVRFEWLRLVMAYSKRSLTKQSDKLPAISGLAHHIPAIFESKYCAGLWENGVQLDLDWKAEARTEPLDAYRAPSWSWAAVDSPVSFTDERSLNKKTPVFEVGNIDIELIGEDNYGQVKSASLTVHGHLLFLNSTRNPFKFHDREVSDAGATPEELATAVRGSELEVTDGVGKVTGWFAPDRTPPVPAVLPCLILYHCRDKDNDEYYSAMFLEPVDSQSSPQIFRRLGRGSVWDLDIKEVRRQ